MNQVTKHIKQESVTSCLDIVKMERRVLLCVLIALLANFSFVVTDSDEDIPHNE